MKNRLLLVCCVALAAGLVACGERPQSPTSRKSDTMAWQGEPTPYVAAGWNAGDKASWEEQIRARALTQNEYNKVP